MKSILISIVILVISYGIGGASSHPYHCLDDDELSVAEMRRSLPPTNYYINRRLEGFSPAALKDHCASKVFLVWASKKENFSSKIWQDKIRGALGLKAKVSFKVAGVIMERKDKALYCIY